MAIAAVLGGAAAWPTADEAYAAAATLDTATPLAESTESVAALDAAAQSVRVGGLTFKAWNFDARVPPIGERPFDHSTPGDFKGDAENVSMYWINGVPYDFPLRQASTGYHALSSYLLTGEKRYLLHAEAQAKHLIAIRVVQGKAWFYPARFPYLLNRTRPELLVPPWYQGLAQGIAVGFFARLYEVTGDAKYKNAAEHTLESFLTPKRTGKLWVSAVDSNGYLCIEEYPSSNWHFVLNGHMQAALGLWDYYRVTGDQRALKLYRGALTAIVRYGEAFRTPGWVSAYSLGARALFVHYHVGVMNRFSQLYRLTADRRLVHLWNEFDDDYPAPEKWGTMRLNRGSHNAVRFTSTGAVAQRTVIKTSTGRTFRIDRRTKIAGQSGIWLRIDRGSIKGYYVREVPSQSYVRGAINALTYNPSVRATLVPGAWVAKRFDAAGALVDSRKLNAAAPTSVRAAKRATVNGRRMVMLATGDLEGYWLPERAIKLP